MAGCVHSASVGETDEVLDGAQGLVPEQVDDDVAVVGVDRGDRGVLRHAAILSEFAVNTSRLRLTWQDGKTTSTRQGGPVSLSRKRKKELRKLQKHANDIWGSRSRCWSAKPLTSPGKPVGGWATTATEQVVPQVQEAYGRYAQPYVQRGLASSKSFLTNRAIPATGAVVGSALSAWDAANETRAKLAAGRGLSAPDAKKYAKLADKPRQGCLEEAVQEAFRRSSRRSRESVPVASSPSSSV